MTGSLLDNRKKKFLWPVNSRSPYTNAFMNSGISTVQAPNNELKWFLKEDSNLKYFNNSHFCKILTYA